jgi:hypothetical protein
VDDEDRVQRGYTDIGPRTPCRKPYRAPAMKVYGTVQNLTRGSNGSLLDQGNPGTRMG